MKYTVKPTNRFRKDYKLMEKRNLDMSLLSEPRSITVSFPKRSPEFICRLVLSSFSNVMLNDELRTGCINYRNHWCRPHSTQPCGGRVWRALIYPQLYTSHREDALRDSCRAPSAIHCRSACVLQDRAGSVRSAWLLPLCVPRRTCRPKV